MQVEVVERSDKAFKIDYNPKVGRHLISNRDIEPGEIIVDDFPLVLGPSTYVDPNVKCSSDPVSVCPTCYQKLLISFTNLNLIVSKNDTKNETIPVDHDNPEKDTQCDTISKPEQNRPKLSETTTNSADSILLKNDVKKETSSESDSEQNSESDSQEKPKMYICLKCGLTLCSKVCSEKSVHVENECKLFQRIPSLHSALQGTRDLHQFITTIRCLFYRKNDPVKWAQVKELQGRVEELQKIGVFDGLEKAFSLLSWDLFGIQEENDSAEVTDSEKDIVNMARHCQGILRTNAFSRFSSKYSIECLYFLSSFMSHNCMMNTDRSFDMDGVRLVTRAARKILKGQPVTTTYLSHLSNNTERQREMKSVWNFSCDCERCLDPTECTSFLSTINCPSCNSLTLNPHPTNSNSENNDDYNWICSNESCENIMTDTSEIRSHLHRTVWLVENAQPDISDLKGTENWLAMYDNGKFLHSNHSIFLQVKLHLCQKYGSGGGMSSLSEEELNRKLTFCNEVTEVLNKILRGKYLLKGVVLFELWLALQETRTRKGRTKETPDTVDTTADDDMITDIAHKAKEILRFCSRSSAEELMFNILHEEN